MTGWKKTILAVALVLASLLGYVVYSAEGGEGSVGFQTTQATDSKGAPVLIGVWYPTEARTWPTTLLGLTLMKVAKEGPIAGTGLPLVVISHGNGAGVTAHVDLALALASNGYVVAAPMHSGDNFQDQSAVGTDTFFNLRSQQFLASIDHMATKWRGKSHIDPDRVGAFGMSMGGFTVLTAIGALPELGRIATHCAGAKEFVCDVLRHFKSPYAKGAPKAGEPFLTDHRIKAAVLAAPGLGFTMTAASLGAVKAPVQLWTGDKDDKVIDPGPVRHLGKQVEYHSVGGAGHLSFLAPCMWLLRPPATCSDIGEFDRAAFHATMNASVVRFFDAHLKRGRD